MCLTVLLFLTATIGGYVAGQWVGAKTGPMGYFISRVLESLTRVDCASISAKVVLSSLLWSTLCCAIGFGSSEILSDFRRTIRLAAQRSVLVCVLVSGLISTIAYL
jgi:hypothetical protein